MSDVWNYFCIDPNDKTKAVCKLCKKCYSRGQRLFNTSNLKKHLDSKHKLEVAEANKKKIKLSVPDPPTEVRNTSDNQNEAECIEHEETNIESCSSGSVSTNTALCLPKPVSKQVTLASYIDRKTKFKPGDSRSKVITKYIAQMICLDNQPFYIVEKRGFTELIHHLEPRYQLPSRKHLATNVIPSLYNECKTKVKLQIENIDFISVTTDLWSSTANDDYLSITVHFINSEFELKHFCLEVIPFPEQSHTGENIRNVILQTFADWNLAEAKLVAVVRDNGRNVVKALEESGFTHISCLAHTLQLVVNKGILSSPSVSHLTANCRRVVGHFKHSVVACKLLKKAQKTLNLPEHLMIQDEPTRWNSTLHMIARLVEQKQAVILVDTEHQLPVQFTANQWELMQNVVDILKIFDKATFTLSRSDVTLSEVLPIVTSTWSELEKPSGNAVAKNLQSELLIHLKSRCESFEKKPLYCLATLLDPRLKGFVFRTPELFKNAKDILINTAKELDKTSPDVAVSILTYRYVVFIFFNNFLVSNFLANCKRYRPSFLCSC